MVAGAFVYLMQPRFGLAAWMVATIIGRELLVTGFRGWLESLGLKFGADWFGKLKMLLQCVVLFAIFSIEALGLTASARSGSCRCGTRRSWLMLAATVGAVCNIWCGGSG